MATKKLLKIFLFIFSIYIFTIKIFLKNTLLCLDLQNKERRRQETQNKKENTKEATNIQNKIEEWQIWDVWASFKADFGYSKMIQGRFRPFQSSADIAWFSPNRPSLARISEIRSRVGANQAELSRIHKKKNNNKAQTRHRHTGSHVKRRTPRQAVLDSGVAPSQPRSCFIAKNSPGAYSTKLIH